MTESLAVLGMMLIVGLIFFLGMIAGILLARQSADIDDMASSSPAPSPDQYVRIEQENANVDPGPFRIQIGTKEIEVGLIDVLGASLQVRERGTGYLHMVPISAVKPDCLPQVLAAVNAHPGRNQVLEFEDGQRLASAIRYGNPPQG